eukprot:PhM_4_TR6779/c0_g1_i1/m.20256
MHSNPPNERRRQSITSLSTSAAVATDRHVVLEKHGYSVLKRVSEDVWLAAKQSGSGSSASSYPQVWAVYNSSVLRSVRCTLNFDVGSDVSSITSRTRSPSAEPLASSPLHSTVKRNTHVVAVKPGAVVDVVDVRAVSGVEVLVERTAGHSLADRLSAFQSCEYCSALFSSLLPKDYAAAASNNKSVVATSSTTTTRNLITWRPPKSQQQLTGSGALPTTRRRSSVAAIVIGSGSAASRGLPWDNTRLLTILHDDLHPVLKARVGPTATPASSPLVSNNNSNHNIASISTVRLFVRGVWVERQVDNCVPCDGEIPLATVDPVQKAAAAMLGGYEASRRTLQHDVQIYDLLTGIPMRTDVPMSSEVRVQVPLCVRRGASPPSTVTVLCVKPQRALPHLAFTMHHCGAELHPISLVVVAPRCKRRWSTPYTSNVPGLALLVAEVSPSVETEIFVIPCAASVAAQQNAAGYDGRCYATLGVCAPPHSEGEAVDVSVCSIHRDDYARLVLCEDGVSLSSPDVAILPVEDDVTVWVDGVKVARGSEEEVASSTPLSGQVFRI